MLVVSRKAGERIMIGPNITLTVLEVRGSTVKLGCEAPANVSIHRPEAARKTPKEDTASGTLGAALTGRSIVIESALEPSSIGPFTSPAVR